MRSGAVVIGVDGVRYDALLSAETPNIDAIVERGMLSSFTVNDEAPVNSGPLWASVATGVWPNFHGVYDNSLAGHRLGAFPDFLHALSLNHKHVRTYVATSWRPLATRMFRPAHRTVALHGDATGYAEADEEVARDAAEVFARDKADAAFIHLGEPDSIGHRYGVGSDYSAAISRADARIGRIIAPLLASSDVSWTIIVVTDHGHVDSGGHGGRTTEETTAWLAATGPGIVATPASHVDVFPTVFAALGAVPHPGLGLAGRALQRGQSQ